MPATRNPPKSRNEIFEDLVEEMEELIERASAVLDRKKFEDFVFEAEVTLETFL
jgi:hypothetical protein